MRAGGGRGAPQGRTALSGADPGGLEVQREGPELRLLARGAWTIAEAAALDPALRAVGAEGARRARIDLSAVTAMDSAGAWLVHRTRLALDAAGAAVTVEGGDAARQALLARVSRHEPVPPAARERRHAAVDALERLGAGTLAALQAGRSLVSFLGLVSIAIARSLRRPSRIRLVPLVVQMERTGLDALPIVGLLAFLIGVVLAYQGVDQLRNFGAEIFAVNLLGLSVLREIGVLITAIMVAGRSGSAFAAQIGTMKVNQEVDAMATMGLDPVEVLVIPRVLALVLVLPLLTFFADVVALFGGAVALMGAMELSPTQFMRQLAVAVDIQHFWVGLVKAPFFAFVIGLVGCHEGLAVSGSAESVGRRTTMAVVKAIFLVIALDAVFSIMFSRLGL